MNSLEIAELLRSKEFFQYISLAVDALLAGMDGNLINPLSRRWKGPTLTPLGTRLFSELPKDRDMLFGVSEGPVSRLLPDIL